MVMTTRQGQSGEPAPAARDGGLRRLTESASTWHRVVLACLAVVAAACATVQGDLATKAITAEELLAGGLLAAAGSQPTLVAEEQVLALTPEMRDFLDTHVDRKGGGNLKLHQLVSAMVEAESFGLVYDEITRTASQTFRDRRGNCLSFSNMFVAMARDVGLDVEFQEVDIPPDWTFDKDTFVLNRHINVFVSLGSMPPRVVDFNIGDFKSTYDMWKVTDRRARAHFYNNIGVEHMQAGDTAVALACFRKAIADNDAGFSPAWTNLGTLYLRNGHPAHAEAAFLQALEASPTDLVAMSNLARLYERQGDRQRAEAFQKRVAEHRRRNPYYRYQLALQAYRAQDYDTAIEHLKYAIGKRVNEDQFYYLLGLCYLRKGDQRAAGRWLARAEEVAATDALKRRYSSKIDTLLHPHDPGQD